MARADLLVRLIRAESQGDKVDFRNIAKTLAAEEEAKGHKVLAKRILDSIAVDGRGHTVIDSKYRDLFYKIMPERRLSSMFLSANVLEQIQDLIEEQHESEKLRAHNLPPRNRILLAGPPGNGKTSLAEAISAELGFPFIVIRYEGLIGSYLGETATRLQRIIEYAKTQRCVLFLDEFETIGKERGDTNETGEIKRIVSSLLLQIDSLPDYVVVIAASNHAELLDKAVWRRFQIKVELSFPDFSQITRFIVNISEQANINLGQDKQLDLNAEILALELEGASFAEVEEMCLTIARKAVLRQKTDNAMAVAHQVVSQWRQRVIPK